MAIAQTQRFLVGNVISQTFAAFFTRILPFGGLALVGFLPTLIFLVGYLYMAMHFPGLFEFPTPGEPNEPVNPDGLAELPWLWISVGFIVLYLASIASSAMWFAATAYGTFQYLRGQPVRFWQSLQRGVAVLLPSTGIILIIGLGALLIGLIFFIPVLATLGDIESIESIVGLVLWVFFATFALFAIFAAIGVRVWMAVPVAAVERPGIFASFRRSWSLSRGHAWRMFGVLLIMIAGSFGASMAASGVIVVLLLTVGGMTGMLVGQGLNILLSIVTNALFAIAGAVSYVELRRAKEGFGLEDIAAVFD